MPLFFIALFYNMSVLQHNDDTYPFPLGGIIYQSAQFAVTQGFLPADGRALSRDVYWELFEYIGGLYGVGDGSTTFNLPDLITSPFIYGINSAPTGVPNTGGISGLGGFTIPVGAIPSLSSSKVSSTLTFSGTTSPAVHQVPNTTSLLDVNLVAGTVNPETIKKDSSGGTGASVSLNSVDVGFINGSQTSPVPTYSPLVDSVGGITFIPYIRVFSNFGNRPSAKPIPYVPPTPQFISPTAPYLNYPYLGGLPLTPQY